MRTEYIVDRTKQLLSECGERNPYSAAVQAGVLLKYKDIGGLKGVYLGNMTPPIVIINNSLDEVTQKIICAHELGHHILHKGQLLSCKNINLSSAAILEREANIFAASFLIDEKEALSLLNDGNTIAETASIMETDTNLLLFLLNTLKLTEAPESTFLK